jgi:hypothetical protein
MTRDLKKKNDEDNTMPADSIEREGANALSAGLLFLQVVVRSATWKGAGAALAAGLAMRLLGSWPSLSTALVVMGAAFVAAKLFQPLDAWYRRKNLG